MPRATTRFTPILLLFLLPLLHADENKTGSRFRAPAFDVNGIEASAVVALPNGYSAERKWPLVLDFHGAISPTRKGAAVTRAALWSKFVRQHDYIVVGLNSRTRAWGTVKGEHDDRAYARHILAAVKKRWTIDEDRVYVAGFSSGSDFLCTSRIATEDWVKGCLVVCPGPPSVVGLRGGELVAAKAKPFFFLTGEEDYIRKSGAWVAFTALEAVGGQTAYREVPGVAHAFPPIAEYADALSRLDWMARGEADAPVGAALTALRRGDFLTASTRLTNVLVPEASHLFGAIEKIGERDADRAAALSVAKEPGHVYEAWWRILTQFHRFPAIADRAKIEMAALEEKIPRRELYMARRDWFRRRGRAASTAADPSPGTREKARAFGFDRYLDFEAVERRLKQLAEEHPDRTRLVSMGKSIEGRDLWVLEVTNRAAGKPEDKPAIYVQGGLHGNELSSVMVTLYLAWQLTANPDRSRGTDRVLSNTTFYIAPAVNPDGLQHCLTEPHTPWRPRFNFRPHDADGDGKIDEDPYEDLNGDGEVSHMYAPDPNGPFVLKDGRLVRGKEGQRYRAVGLEGIDNDGDGKFNEDRPGGVNLNRNFPVGFRARKEYEGTRGTGPASEPETKAIVNFVTGHPNIALFLDYHNHGDCLYYWLGPKKTGDEALYEAVADRVRKSLGYPPRPLKHAGAGLAAAWAYGKLGIPSFIVELEPARGNREAYYRSAWKGQAFIAAKPFEHPQLGPVLIGNDYRKIPFRNLHPDDLFWQADRNWAWLKAEAPHLPRLEIRDPVITLRKNREDFEVRGLVANTGTYPLNTGRTPEPKGVLVDTYGGGQDMVLSPRDLPGGAVANFATSILAFGDEDVAASVSHPRAGRTKLPVCGVRSPTVPIRREYTIEGSYATPDTAVRANNGHFTDGVAKTERGPAFDVTLAKDEMRVGVLLGEWEDYRHSFPKAAFERALFSRGEYTKLSPTGQPVYGSLADFYAESSYDRVKVTGKVFDWVTLPGKWEEARDASFGSRELHERMIELVRKRDGEDALEGFDGLIFIWAGNAVKRTSMLWPMRLKLRDPKGVAAFKTGERHLGEFMPVGIACHEMGHTFGVNDKYGLGASKNPLGPFCLIGKGTHGFAPSGRHRPFRFCAWCRSVIGWVTPTVIDPATPQNLALRPALFGPGEAFRVLLTPDGEESLYLTNRRREGFDTDLPCAGLFVLSVGPNDKPSAPQGRVELLPAHGLPPADRSMPSRPEAVAWPQPEKTAFTVGGVTVSEIRMADDVVYFRVGPAK